MRSFRIIFFVGISFLSSACVLQKEREESAALLDELLYQQCQQTLAFRVNSNAYSDCYNQYRTWLLSYGIDSDLSYKKIESAKKAINTLNQACYTHWGNQNISSTLLRECIQQKIRPQLLAYQKKQNSAVQEQNLMRSVQQGSNSMNEQVLLQEYMEKEKQKISQETGKNINKIDCHISKTFTGGQKVTCY